MCNSKEMRAETRHCNFVAGHSVYTLETITNVLLLNGEPVYALQAKLLFFKGTNPALKKPSNIPEIYAKMFDRFH